jgi:RNA polymerase sigma-70 factor (ECF subfamily)
VSFALAAVGGAGYDPPVSRFAPTAPLPPPARGREIDPASVAPLSLRELFHDHYARVWRLLRRLGVPPALVDDALQEVFLVASRRLGDIRPGKERSFLHGVALRVASDQRRRQASRPATRELLPTEPVADAGPSPEETLERRRERELLDEVLSQMRGELREVLVLFELEELEVKQIAELQRIPIGTAGSRLRRAREEFAAIVRRLRARLDGAEAER